MARVAAGAEARTRWGASIVTIVSGGYLAVEIAGVIDHIRESEWPHHADYHALTGLFLLLTLSVVAVALAWSHVRRGDRTAWWLVTAIGIVVFGGGLLADPLTSHGLEGGGLALLKGTTAYALVACALVLWLIAMALARPARQVITSE